MLQTGDGIISCIYLLLHISSVSPGFYNEHNYFNYNIVKIFHGNSLFIIRFSCRSISVRSWEQSPGPATLLIFEVLPSAWSESHDVSEAARLIGPDTPLPVSPPARWAQCCPALGVFVGYVSGASNSARHTRRGPVRV